MSVRITEPAPIIESDGPRRRSIMVQVGEDALMLEVEWQANRYEFTEYVSVPFDGGWTTGKRLAAHKPTWQGVIDFVAIWCAEQSRGLL